MVKAKFSEVPVHHYPRSSGESAYFNVFDIYKTFREMLEAEGVKNVLPDKNNIKEAIKVYKKFYKKSQENRYGVLAIRIKRM